MPLARAAVDGTDEVAAAVSASTLTTVAVFLPIVFVEGIAGQLFKDQALTVTISQLASLAVALTVIPMLSALGRARPQGGRRPATSSDTLDVDEKTSRHALARALLARLRPLRAGRVVRQRATIAIGAGRCLRGVDSRPFRWWAANSSRRSPRASSSSR